MIYTINTRSSILYPLIKSYFKLSETKIYNILNQEFEAMKKHLKKTAVFLAAALLCEAVMPVSALEENVKKQLEAVKSLADLDLDSNAAAIQILLQQCMDLLPDGDPVKATLQSIQVLTDGGSQNTAAVDLLLDGLLQESMGSET